MSIQLNINNPQNNTQVTATFNASRLEKILHAGSLNEAQRMGVFDKIKDIFRGGVKAEAIRLLYDQITDPDPHETNPVDMLHRLNRLLELAEPKDNYLSFVGEVMRDDPALQEGQWKFQLRAGGEVIYQSEILQDAAGTSKFEFIQANQLHRWINVATHKIISAKIRGKDQLDSATLLVNQLRQVMNDSDVKGSTEAEVFAFIRDLHPVNNPYLKKLASTNHSEKSLLSMHFPDQVEEAEQLAKFDKARELLSQKFWLNLSEATAKAEKTIPQQTIQEYALSNTQELTDDSVQRAFIANNLENSLFSRQNFMGIEPGDDETRFKAVFKREGEDPQVLTLSNREPTHGEFRGTPVKELLQSSTYGNLADLLSVGMKGPKDPVVVASSNYLASKCVQWLDLESGTTEVMSAFLQNLNKNGPPELAEKTFNALRNIRLADTDLLTIWMGDLAPAAKPRVDLIAAGSMA